LQGPHYLKIWETIPNDKIIRETHTQIVTIKKEKDQMLYDHCWVPMGNNPVLLVLGNGNNLYIIQGDHLKRIQVIDTSQLNLLDVVRAGVVEGLNDGDDYLAYDE
jgi:hypothetical protein